MKLLMIAAALAMSGAAYAQNNQQPVQEQVRSGADPDARQGQWDPNGPGTPPGDGITALGNDPEGQAFTPMGYNAGLGPNVYPPVAAAPPGLIGGEYPICSERVTDRCVQAYSKYANVRRR